MGKRECLVLGQAVWINWLILLCARFGNDVKSKSYKHRRPRQANDLVSDGTGGELDNYEYSLIWNDMYKTMHSGKGVCWNFSMSMKLPSYPDKARNLTSDRYIDFIYTCSETTTIGSLLVFRKHFVFGVELELSRWKSRIVMMTDGESRVVRLLRVRLLLVVCHYESRWRLTKSKLGWL